MAIVIPIKDTPNHTLLIDLDGKIYKLGFLYNTKFNYWTMDIYTEDDVLLLAGIKIVPNYALIYLHVNANLPTGDFICEMADVKTRVVRDSFTNGSAKLLYLTKDELETL